MTTTRVNKMLQQDGKLISTLPEPEIKQIKIQPREHKHIPQRLSFNQLDLKLKELETRVPYKPPTEPVKRWWFCGGCCE